MRHPVWMPLHRSRARTINEHTQRAMLAASQEFDVYHFQPARGGNAIRDLPDLFLIKCHLFCYLREGPVRRFRCKLKSGLSPTGVLRHS